MSYTEVFAIRENGDITKYDEAHNAFGGAMFIWMTLKEKYNVSQATFMNFNPLWEKCGTLEEADNWVLASTFDNVVISKERLPSLIKGLKTFTAVHSTATLKAEIEILERALEDGAIQGVAFNHTSVNADTWTIFLPEDEIIDDETRPYNINKDTGHWYLTPEELEA